MATYTCRRIVGGYRLVKFDDLLNVDTIHIVIGWYGYKQKCDCERGQFPSCRHRIMITEFERTNRVDKGYFYNYDLRTWELPILLQQKLKR